MVGTKDTEGVFQPNILDVCHFFMVGTRYHQLSLLTLILDVCHFFMVGTFPIECLTT